MLFGYFHQKIFKYIDNCVVPESGWDVIYTDKKGKRYYAEVKNKYNTMNDGSSRDAFNRMLRQINEEPDAVCFLVEAISTRSRDIVWGRNGNNDNRIRRISIDRFFELVTGDKDAFFKVCMVLPEIIDEIMEESEDIKAVKDTAFDELKKKDKNLVRALYLLAFDDYYGFKN